MITDACISCGACEPECPNNAIYEGGVSWNWAEGTRLQQFQVGDKVVDATTSQEPYSEQFYYIATDKCTECVGFHEEPQCAAVCPVDCCVLDLDNQETPEILLDKKKKLHQD